MVFGCGGGGGGGRKRSRRVKTIAPGTRAAVAPATANKRPSYHPPIRP